MAEKDALKSLSYVERKEYEELKYANSEEEKQNAHPVFRAYIESRICRSFATEEARQKVVPAYMGMVKQIDDQLGLLFDWMEQRGLFDNTVIRSEYNHGIVK